MFYSCDKRCLSPENEARNQAYYEQVSFTKYLLTENATQRIFIIASTDHPADTDSSAYIKSFVFQHLKSDGSTYKTTDQFTFDSLPTNPDQLQIAYVGGYALIDTNSGKFFMDYGRHIDSSRVEYNANVAGMVGFEIYRDAKEVKQINMSRITPTIIVANPQKTTNFKALASAYNWYTWQAAGFESTRLYRIGK